MSLSKFKFLIFLLFFFSANSFAGFSDMECLNANFQTEVSHKVMWKVKRTLNIEKRNCLITIDFYKYNKFLGGRWVIDICRAPIHIKKGRDGVSVIKKTSACGSGGEGKFCAALTEIEQIIQDDGLIFADGEKENLSSDHGRVHCTNLLLKAYMKRDFVFSRQKEYKDILRNFKKTPMPEVKPVQVIMAPTKSENGSDNQMEMKELYKAPSAPVEDSSGAEGTF